MSPFIIASVVLALLLYIPLAVSILRGTAVQNFATWLLWAILDGIAASTILVKGGNFYLPLAYSIGSLSTVVCIFKSNSKNTWGRFENMVTVLVIICLVVWYTAGPKTATIASSLAMIIAGMPQLIESYRKPWESPLIIYAGYTIANLLSTIGGKSWTIEERFYPAGATAYCGMIVLGVFLLRQRKSPA